MTYGIAPVAHALLIAPGADPPMKPRLAVLHVDAGNASSLYGYLKDRSGRRSPTSVDRSTKSTDDLGRSAGKSGAEIDKLSGRVRVLADVAPILGPSLAPVGALAIPAMSGLAEQFGFAATAAGVGVLAFQGVGDALKAMNKAGVEPTTANLQAAQMAMANISPAAQGLVRQLRSMIPEPHNLRDTAAEGLFPGMTEGLNSLESALPKVERIVGAVAGELGNLASDSGASLASPRWADFLDFLATDAPQPCKTWPRRPAAQVTRWLSCGWRSTH